MKLLIATVVTSGIAFLAPSFAQPTAAGAPSILYGLTGRDTAAAPHGILSGSRSINVFSPAKYGTKADDTTFGTDVIYGSSTSSDLITDASVVGSANSKPLDQRQKTEPVNTVATGPMVGPSSPSVSSAAVSKGSETGSATADAAANNEPAAGARKP